MYGNQASSKTTSFVQSKTQITNGRLFKEIITNYDKTKVTNFLSERYKKLKPLHHPQIKEF